MATLSDDELARIRRELLDHVLDIGALPYVDFRQVYQIIRDHTDGSATAATSSSSAVSATGAGTITVASAAGLAVGAKVVVDVDDQRETVTVKSLSGTTLGANFRKTHSGTYPVELESALTLVRGVLFDLSRVQDELNTARLSAGVKKADEVEFFGAADGRTLLDELRAEQARLRLDLARMVGLASYVRGAGGGTRLEVY